MAVGPIARVVVAWISAVLCLVALTVPWWNMSTGVDLAGASFLFGWRQAYCSPTGPLGTSAMCKQFGGSSFNWRDRCITASGEHHNPMCDHLGKVYDIAGVLMGFTFLASFVLAIVLTVRARNPKETPQDRIRDKGHAVRPLPDTGQVP